MDSSDTRDQLTAAKVQQEAPSSAIRHVGPTADRYANALERYVSAMSILKRTDPRVGAHQHRGFPPMTVADVMTTAVVTAYEGALFKEIAQALYRNGINAVPVINEDRHVVGVVTVSDLLTRIDHCRPLPPSHRTAGRAERRRRLHAHTARELMTSPAITTHPAASLADAARLFHRYRLRSMPVIDLAGTLLGMVSRADLIALFLRSDDDIKNDVERDVICRSTVPGRAKVTVTVDEGVVTLSGRVATALVARGLAHRASEVPGVLDVHDRLEFDANDLYLPIRH